MTRRHLVGAFVLVAGLTMIPTGSATASCAAPSLAAPAGVAQPGLATSVTGNNFVDGCDDTGGNDSFGCEAERETVTPIEGVQLRMRQDEHTWTLDTSDASSTSDGTFGQVTWNFQVPDAAKPGKAFLETDYSEPTQIVIAAAG